jgi:tetratricopeptide (TPR) repeat protein
MQRQVAIFRRTRRVALFFALLLNAELNFLSQADSRALAAEDSLEDMFQARLAARGLADRGFLLAREGEFQRALILFNAAIENDPTYSPAFYLRAAMQLKISDFAGAIPDLDKVIALDPNYSAALNDRGFARWQTGDLSGALKDFDRCIALRSDWGLPYANRAALKQILGDTAGALEDLHEALRIDPSLASPNERSLAITGRERAERR